MGAVGIIIGIFVIIIIWKMFFSGPDYKEVTVREHTRRIKRR